MTTRMSSVLFLYMMTVTMVISIQSNLDYPNLLANSKNLWVRISEKVQIIDIRYKFTIDRV